MAEVRVKTATGVALSLRDEGPAAAPPLVFLHGIAQSKESWSSLLEGAMSKDFRLLALDLRGHGDSDKPEAPEELAHRRLADDVEAVIGGLGLRKPVLVAWSFGGVVVGEYLRRHGDGALGGIVFLAAAVRTGRDARGLFGPGMLDHARSLLSEEEATYEAGARAFVESCAARPLPPAIREGAVSRMRVVPARVRRAFLGGGDDYSPEVAGTRVPIAALHGELDTVVKPEMSAWIAGLRPGVHLRRLPGVGHLPWVEAPADFEAALRAALAP